MPTRSVSPSRGAGASSMSFWYRRCTEQSRSPRWITFSPSPSSCTSTCRAGETYRSRYTRGSENAACASALATATAPASSARIADHPQPPPPAAPRRLDQHRIPDPPASARAASAAPAGPTSPPGSTGSPAATAWFRAASLSPAASSTSALGPMNTMPAASHARASRGFSDRKP